VKWDAFVSALDGSAAHATSTTAQEDLRADEIAWPVPASTLASFVKVPSILEYGKESLSASQCRAR
jgi:hypothetical protein